MLLIDNAAAQPVVFFMRKLCSMYNLPFGLGDVVADGGRLLKFFIETYCNDIVPLHDDTHELRSPPVMGRFGLAVGADGVASRVAQDADADRVQLGE